MKKKIDAHCSKIFKPYVLDKFQSKPYNLANEEDRKSAKVPLIFLLNFIIYL